MRLIYLLCVLIALPVQASSRLAFGKGSPDWLAGVGKLDVPSQRWEQREQHHFKEHCSATLLFHGERARYVLSAWHCLENYRDLSRDISFRIPGSELQRNAFPVASGGGMEADWALLQLDRPVARSTFSPLQLADKHSAEAAITMAGFSRDVGLGRSGSILTYDPACQVTGRSNDLVATNCEAYKGASGGPVVAVHKGRALLLGVVSTGTGEGQSYYVPAHVFIHHIKPYLPRGAAL